MKARDSQDRSQVLRAIFLSAGCIAVLAIPVHAGLSGDFRNMTLDIGEGLNGDLALNVQTDEQGQTQATGGVTVKKGEKVSFDYRGSLKTQTAGFWRGEKDRRFKVLFRDPEGNRFAIVELQGQVRWNPERDVTEGKDNFLRIASMNAPDKFLEITNRGIMDGRLTLSANDGSLFTVYDLSCDFSGTIATGPRLRINPSVAMQVAGVRSWLPPSQQWTLLDGIAGRSFNCWKLDDLHLASRSGLMMISEGVGERIKTVKTGSALERKVVKALQPKGKFVEVLLIFTNTSREPIEENFSEPNGILDIRIVLPDRQKVLPTDFQFPGVAGSGLANFEELHKKGLTVVSELTLATGAKLGIDLDPNDSTYALLLFDVPKETTAANIQVKATEALKLEFIDRPNKPSAKDEFPGVSVDETYQELDSRELHMRFEAALKSLEVDSAGNVVSVDGTVKTLAVGDETIALLSDKIQMDGPDAVIATKDYGKIKVTFDSNARATFWLKPSQKEQIKKLNQ